MTEVRGKTRIQYFDIAKGIAMICIILGHFGISRVNSVVFTFHVPIFFIISGYFLKTDGSVTEYAKRKACQLLIPYAVTSVFNIAGTTIEEIIRTKTTENAVYNIKTWLVGSLYGSGSVELTDPFYVKPIGALWFLPAMFFALVLVKYFLQFKWGAAGIAAMAYIGWKTAEIVWLPFSIQPAMTAALFVYVGYLAKKYDVLKKTPPAGVLSGIAGVWGLCAVYCGVNYLVSCYFRSGLLDILGALAGSYLVIFLSKLIEKYTKHISGILTYIGKNSLLIMCCHAFELNVISWKWVEDLLSTWNCQYFTVIWVKVVFKLLLFAVCVEIIHRVQKLWKRIQRMAEERTRKEKSGYIADFVDDPANGDGSGAADTSQKGAVVSGVGGKGRILYWDAVKGVAIMLMILGHTDVPDYLRILIFSFHMPLFIIVNGYFIKSYDVKRTFCRSVKSLIVPYMAVCLISAVIYAFMGRGSGEAIFLFMQKIKAMAGGMSKTSTRFQSFESVWVVWFVICLFVTRNLYVILMKGLEKYSQSVRIAVILLLAAAGYAIGNYVAYMPWSLDVALVSLIFIAFGHWMRKTDFLEKNYFYTLVLPAVIWVYFMQLGIHIELATRSYPLGAFCMIEAAAGSVVMISLTKYLCRFRAPAEILAWIGKNSMLILGIHCLELMYMDWERWVYAYLPITMTWMRVFLIKSVLILGLVFIIDRIKAFHQLNVHRKVRYNIGR